MSVAQQYDILMRGYSIAIIAEWRVKWMSLIQ